MPQSIQSERTPTSFGCGKDPVLSVENTRRTSRAFFVLISRMREAFGAPVGQCIVELAIKQIRM